MRCGGRELCDPVVVGFDIKNKKKKSKGQFIAKIEEQNFNFIQIEQYSAYDIFIFLRALKVNKKIKPDILQSHGYKSHAICFVIKILTGTPWVAFFHGWVSFGLKVYIYNKMEKILLHFADKIVPVSSSMVSKIDSFFLDKNKIKVIYNAIDNDEHSLANSNRNIREEFNINLKVPLVAVVGRFSHEKGHRYFVEALPQIIQELPELKVMFIGDGPLKETIQKKVEILGLNPHVIFTDYQSNVQDFYREIDLLVLPSMSEGMPNVALEAMLFEKPVVSTHVGGVPEVVVDGETGIIVEPQAPKQLAEAVIRLFENPDMLHDFGVAGRERVLREFDPVQRVKKITAMYEEVLKTKS